MTPILWSEGLTASKVSYVSGVAPVGAYEDYCQDKASGTGSSSATLTPERGHGTSRGVSTRRSEGRYSGAGSRCFICGDEVVGGGVIDGPLTASSDELTCDGIRMPVPTKP